MNATEKRVISTPFSRFNHGGWKGDRTMNFITGKELLKKFQKHEIIELMEGKKLTPFSPATLKPYKPVVLLMGLQYPVNPLEDDILPPIVNPFGKLLLYLDDVLFDPEEVAGLHKKIMKENKRGPGEASRELGEWTTKDLQGILEKYGGVAGYKNLKHGQKTKVIDEFVKKTKAKDNRNFYNVLKKIEALPDSEN